MLKQLLSTISAISLVSCGGVLVYDNNDKIFIGILDNNNLNEMKSTGQVHAKGSFDRMEFAIDAGGTFVGVCRTKFFIPENEQTGQREVEGEVDLHIFDVTRQARVSASNKEILTRVDQFASTPWVEATESPSRYVHCYQMGASTTKSNLVLYFQPQGFEESDLDFAIEVDVSGTALTVVDHETFPKGGSPNRVVAHDNPLKGNTVGILSNRIAVNSVSVNLNGNAVAADRVKHHFK